MQNEADTGMLSGRYAAATPERIALFAATGNRTFRQLHENANRLARAFRRAGLAPGDPVALMCGNRAEFVETLLACLRTGLRLTPVNWHLAKDEAAYIVADCEAKAVVAEARFAEAIRGAGERAVMRLSIDGAGAGFEPYDAALAREACADPEAPELGTIMLYTSGTTGRPKGVYREKSEVVEPQLEGSFAAYDPMREVNLCCGPAYHAAPLLFDVRWPLASGVPIVMLDGWNSEGVLEAIARYRVTHAHMVPIMFQRLLSLPADVRGRYDLSSLRVIFHGAAPCPAEVKRAMIAWLGPILHEYYAASEGGAGIHITAEEWLRKPGSVGKRPDGDMVRILDAAGAPVRAGQAGDIYMKVSENPFSYFKAPDKTEAQHKDGYFTLGDVGYFDDDGYLFLTGRTAECIISGGVNIYPREIDDVLLQHPSVADVCTVGVPNDEWGEEVRAVVQLKPGVAAGAATASAIIAFARDRLSGFKCPRVIDFVDELPRLPSGKVQRGRVRAPYWAGRERAI